MIMIMNTMILLLYIIWSQMQKNSFLRSEAIHHCLMEVRRTPGTPVIHCNRSLGIDIIIDRLHRILKTTSVQRYAVPKNHFTSHRHTTDTRTMTPETERKPTSLPVAMGEDPTTANSTVEPCKRQIKWRFELALLLLCITAAVAVIAGTVVSRQDKSSTSSSDQTNDANVEPSNEPQGRKCFEDRDELLGAVQDYLGNKRHQVTCKYGPISNWCVDQITNFTAIFRDQKDFNESLDGWEMSQATTLREMFSGCSKFNQDLHYWDVSNVEVSRMQ